MPKQKICGVSHITGRCKSGIHNKTEECEMSEKGNCRKKKIIIKPKKKVVKKVVKPKARGKKEKKVKVEKRSSYFNMYFTGDNEDEANKISQMMTWNHSEKIKDGNKLETNIFDDVRDNSKISTFKGIKVVGKPDSNEKNYTPAELNKLSFPCFVNSFKIDKKLYLDNGLICSNKTHNEIDFAVLTKNKSGIDIKIIEVKSGCDFDTKKSKGEIQTLTATTTLFEILGFKSSAYIMSWDAQKTCDIHMKSDLKSVQLILYNDMLRFINLNGNASRARINEINKVVATKRIELLKKKMLKILSS